MSGGRDAILLVEDSETQALQMRRLLEGEGFAVQRAATAEAALEALNGPLPDLLIADYHLPAMNGDELVRRVRLNHRTRAIAVLMLTEARERELERQGLESGADAYVPKSAGQDLLLLRIKALLRRRAGDVPAEAPPAAAGDSAFRPSRLLLAEGSPTQRLALAAQLTREGHAVEAVGDSEAALARLGADPDGWDGVLLNAATAQFDGVALVERLHAFRGETGASFQVVALVRETGVDGAAQALPARLFAAGADELIPSPAPPETLNMRLRAALRRKLLLDEERRAAAESRERALMIERAQAKAAMAEALSRANEELEAANQQLRETQTRLVQAAKMASLGELVAGIAHEINNPLAFILAHQGTVDRLLRQMETLIPPEAEATPIIARCRDRIGSMTLGLARIQDLVANLRKFSRRDDGAFQRINVPEAVETVLTLLGPKLGDRLVVERDLQGAAELVCLPALLNQVVMNLIGNAADAIPGEGRITIATRSDWKQYTIEIRDSGPGVPEGLREKVFEPFFTTKPIGLGTGLGLAIAYNVVAAHEGAITVGQAPEGGACFTVSVPMRTEA
ncbi:response regulator [Roseomonas marmotae]|uniref:histidine kinase n=1 Tax=Roseomonas marmotae TaxID=2768161 RepID=A0ABS3K9R4_9PROT|nr:response regulator [Roseomonas marmotae]MBO1074198.1 response regulator [Roseomonas marmotae]QTI78969.1 response regulator [Roseomonas marmotae]